MFFIGIFGIESMHKEIREIQNIICKNCKSMSVYKLIKTYDCFQFFFIPIFKWNVKYYVVSRCCNSVFEIPSEKGKALENGKDIELNDFDLNQIHRGNRCPQCGRQIDGDFMYCPYCGGKL